jgi:prophage regulatory protein
MADVYLTDKQIAGRFGLHHLTIRRWVRENPSFPKPIKLSAGCARWKLSEIEAWEKAQAEAPR